jgi:hypothetical protein
MMAAHQPKRETAAMTTKTIEDFKTRSNEEAQTYLLIEAARVKEFNQTRQVILNVFKMCWSLSLTVEKIIAIGAATYCVTINEEECRKELTKLAREKVLRSGLHGNSGKTRFYEVNY